MAEVPYEPDEHGWFRLSRRLVGSSLWVRSSPAALKLAVYLIERATSPMNPYPGDVLEAGSVLADRACLPPKMLKLALKELLGPDPDSQSKRLNGAMLEPLTRNGDTVGYRLVNFEAHNPGSMERGAAVKAERRRKKAKAAAEARWARARAASLALQPGDLPDERESGS